jgi:nucleoside-diphosphate-sugar epimerase
MSNNQELHVIFGTGPLGLAIMEELLARGKRVRMINRSGRAEVPSGVEVVQGDALQWQGLLPHCEGAAVIYNCTNAPYTQWPEKFPPILNGVIETVAAVGAKLVSADNLYMYGHVDGPLTEDLPYAASGRKGRTRARMAQTILEAHAKGRIRATIGRASNFYGPRVLDSVAGKGMFQAILEGKGAQVLGNIDLPHTFTFIRDFAKGLVTLGEREEALGEAWHIPSAETITTRQFVEMVAQEAGSAPKFKPAPRLGIVLLAPFVPFMREVKEMLYEFEKPFIMNHTKFESMFGNHSTPHRDAIRETLDWYRKQMIKPK